MHTNQCVTKLWNAPHTGCWEGNPGLCFHLVSGSLMFTWCPSCTLTFTCPSLACAALPCQLPSPGDLIVQCPFLFSLSVFGCTALCNSVGLPLSGLFFFLDSCRLFIVVPKACRCGVQVHRPNPCLFSFSDAWTLTFDLVLTFDADVYFYYVCFFLFFFLCCQIGFARKTAEGEYLNCIWI